MTAKSSVYFCIYSKTVLVLGLMLLSQFSFGQKKNGRERIQDTSFLADSTVLTKSDYLFHLEKVFEVVNKVPVTLASFTKLVPIATHLDQDEAAIKLLKKRLTQTERGLNLQNLQMYQTLLNELYSNNEDCLADLQDYDLRLNALKTEILNLRKDTVIVKIFRSDSLKKEFSSQFLELKKKRTPMDSLIKANTRDINSLQARTSANLISIKELIYQTDGQLKSIGSKAFGKERRYLWETINQPANRSVGFKRFISSEQQISRYYFIYTRSSRFVLFFIGVLFFFWVFLNYRSLIQREKLSVIEDFNLKMLAPKPFLISLILIFTFAPIFDLRAPALYIEMVHSVLGLLLAYFFFKKMPRAVFYKWCIFLVFIVAPAFLRVAGLPPRFQRWMLLIFSISASAYGIIVMKALGEKIKAYRFLPGIGVLFIVFCILATICNLFGRFTLTQIFYSTGVNALLHAISLTVVTKMIVEAFLLQMKSSRIRKDYPEYFDWQPVIKTIGTQISVGAMILWTVLLTSNLNILDELYDTVISILTEVRKIGNFSFTFGGIVLFLVIIWTANFLQKYISYFFGDTGDDSLESNKGERSKLLVTRLVLLVGGFLIAVAASGLPIDRITVILGALGVGIGLGLQNIVSNFVSGIILIFDKTIRIGDVVELSDKKGRVKEIGIRASTLLSDEGAEIIIPNGAILSNNIINWTLSNNYMRVDMQLTIVKPFKYNEVVALITDVIKSNTNVYLIKEPVVIINPITKLNSNVRIYFWCKDVISAESTKSTINAQLFDAISEKGIEIL
jgi:potassium efflux system protein